MEGREDSGFGAEQVAPLRPGARSTSHPISLYPPVKPKRRRRWTINGDFVALAPNGVARYAREVTLALDSLMAEGHLLTRELDIELVAPRAEPMPLKSIVTRVVPQFDKPRLPQFWVQVQLPSHVRGGLLSFCNLAPLAVKRQIACIHDLHTRLMPGSYSAGFRLAHRLILPLLGRRVLRITTVSQLSRQHLVHYRVAPEHKITVTYNGSDHVDRWDASRSSLKFGPQHAYVLCLGRAQKYKNLDMLLRLCPLLAAMEINMWVAGEIDRRQLSEFTFPIPRNLRLLGRISDDDFKKALQGALCFLLPSRIEGFGLPAVEAMRSGCPVVASTSPCLPEVCGEAALYADPDDTDAWASAVSDLARKPGLRGQLVEAGRRRAQGYSWRRIAEIYLELMAEIDGLQDA